MFHLWQLVISDQLGYNQRDATSHAGVNREENENDDLPSQSQQIRYPGGRRRALPDLAPLHGGMHKAGAPGAARHCPGPKRSRRPPRAVDDSKKAPDVRSTARRRRATNFESDKSPS